MRTKALTRISPIDANFAFCLTMESIRENSCNPCLIPAGAGGNDGPAATIFDTDFTDFH
jgi:hypothetical protein